AMPGGEKLKSTCITEWRQRTRRKTRGVNCWSSATHWHHGTAVFPTSMMRARRDTLLCMGTSLWRIRRMGDSAESILKWKFWRKPDVMPIDFAHRDLSSGTDAEDQFVV